MDTIPVMSAESRQRTLLFLSTPDLWQFWPFLPVVRRQPDGEEELGVVYDALHAKGLAGYSCTVFACNLFMLPPTLEALLASPRETFDTCEEIVAAGWNVD